MGGRSPGDQARTLNRPYVAVVGSGSAPPGEIALAKAVGRGLAERRAVVVCGGLGGVMEGACRGATEAGGRTLGILPGYDRTAANPYVEVAIATGLGEARNALIVRAADALIAIGGSWGTLSEIALGLRAGKRVVGIGSWDLRRAGGEPVEGILEAEDPEEAVRLALG
ncbi:MAG: TIGR00725 family protein [Actinomycetota bacterium]|nr:TIGR00725 family protein [Actinomycetota bacterium]